MISPQSQVPATDIGALIAEARTHANTLRTGIDGSAMHFFEESRVQMLAAQLESLCTALSSLRSERDELRAHTRTSWLESVAKESSIMREALSEIRKLVDLNFSTDEHATVQSVRGLRTDYNEICLRLRECVTKHGLGLGGERLERLVCDEVDALRASLASNEREAAGLRDFADSDAIMTQWEKRVLEEE